MTSEQLFKYLPDLTPLQKQRFEQLPALYNHWNSQINVISRKDIDELYERHILHSLGIAKIVKFLPGEKVLDVGTGGGFPGIPLAILFPETNFYLVDAIGKKIKVVQEVIKALDLKNVRAAHLRAEQVNEKFDFIVSRAVTRLSEFYPWIKGRSYNTGKNILPPGVLYLKGGDLTEEIAESGLTVQLFYLKDHFSEEFFDTKQVVYIKS